VRVFYPSLRSLRANFAPEFRLKSIVGVGVSVPPSYLEPVMNRFPAMLGLFKRVDAILERLPGVRGLADHVLLTLERAASS